MLPNSRSRTAQLVADDAGAPTRARPQPSGLRDATPRATVPAGGPFLVAAAAAAAASERGSVDTLHKAADLRLQEGAAGLCIELALF